MRASYPGTDRTPNHRRRLTFAAELNPLDLVYDVGDG
jgi:hypothetical protein